MAQARPTLRCRLASDSTTAAPFARSERRELRRKETRFGRARGARSESDDQRHRRASGRVEGSGLVRAERTPGGLRRHQGADPGDRTRARLVSEPRCTRSLRRARRRLWARARPACQDDRARAVLHGVHRRRGVRALGEVDRPHHPARRIGRRRDRGVPAVVGRAPCGRRPHGRPAERRPPSARARSPRLAGRRHRWTRGKWRFTGGLARRSRCRDRSGSLRRGTWPHANCARRRCGRVRPHGAAHGGISQCYGGARARGRDRPHGLLGRERRPRDTEAPLVAAAAERDHLRQ